ncbi:MAG TPA: hypothetical protein VFB96_01790 [Pirellulaceae bacterium]|nr:hypothetical protein [Pirellulaceae bacterium]
MFPRSHITRKQAASARNRAVVSQRVVAAGMGVRATRAPLRGPYLPPEEWYEPGSSGGDSYRVIVKPPGEGYRHVLTSEDVRCRLAQLPDWMRQPLEVVQMSQMTRKKRIAPCYGMQWGSTIYLYPIEENLVETFTDPPKPAQQIEARMYGARWVQSSRREWKLVWTESAIRDFYLNNVLIHELGHVLDSRNSRSLDRERFAEWFAVEHGYKASRRAELVQQASAKYIVRRHHRKG